MKIAAFSVLFALVASVIALPAYDASSLKPRQDDCTEFLDYCSSFENFDDCAADDCGVVRCLL